MKTNEFIKRVEALGYEIDNTDNSPVEVVHNERRLALVSKRESHRLDTLWYGKITPELFDLLVEYAGTPIDEREEQPKYYWKAKGLGTLRKEEEKYFNLSIFGETSLGTKENTPSPKTQFTKKEFKEICERHNITAEFEKEEIGE